MIQQTARGSYQNVRHSLLKLFVLPADVRPSDDAHEGLAVGPRQRFKNGMDLRRQFPGRRHHDGRCPRSPRQVFENWNSKSQRFPVSRLCPDHHVSSLQGGRNAETLNPGHGVKLDGAKGDGRNARHRGKFDLGEDLLLVTQPAVHLSPFLHHPLVSLHRNVLHVHIHPCLLPLPASGAFGIAGLRPGRRPLRLPLPLAALSLFLSATTHRP
mmetsp:Transcript_6739/g.19070  ORF Transcript_6739/g.19070 Transcript_6739/m.19070 type:complete len:212 (+) Transcript_6739:1021-1656(+)